MKFEVIHATRRWTRWYYGRDEKGNVVASTQRGELPTVDGSVQLYPGEERILCYCPKCAKIHRFAKYSEFYVLAVEKARDCEEYDRLWWLFHDFRKLAWEWMKEGKRTLAEGDVGYVARRIRKGAHLSLLERFFDVPEEVRVRILARVL